MQPYRHEINKALSLRVNRLLRQWNFLALNAYPPRAILSLQRPRLIQDRVRGLHSPEANLLYYHGDDAAEVAYGGRRSGFVTAGANRLISSNFLLLGAASVH